jgi:hypothetical protein
MSGLPRLFLWAWERPEQLGFINRQNTGVAFLARTVYLRDEEVIVRPRLQPLSVPPGTVLMAVARIEPDRQQIPKLSPGQGAKAAARIAEMANIPGVSAIQIDFDALVSERAFYRDLLQQLRRRLPYNTALTITALASWCMDDNWLSGLPIDEAVPMLFRMGVDHKQVIMHLEAGKDFQNSLCKTSLGISIDEPLSRLPLQRRLYIFNPRSWTQEAFDRYRKVEQ